MAIEFGQTIVAGDTLVTEAIKSQNYVAGSDGWAINQDGSAEFNELTVTGGTIQTDVAPNKRIVLNDPAYPNQIALYSGNSNESQPGLIAPVLGGANFGTLTLQSPVTDGGTTSYAFLNLEGFTDGSTVAEMQADTVRVTAAAGMVLFADTGSQITMGDTTSRGDLAVQSDAAFHAVIINQDETWHSVTFVNSWVDLAGARVQYFKDATGRIQLRGQTVSGTASTIFTLPSGYRPTQSMEWIMRGVGGVVMCAVQVATSGVTTVTANLATAQASGIKLDAISFPTF
jgi:hypothetical protein